MKPPWTCYSLPGLIRRISRAGCVPCDGLPLVSRCTTRWPDHGSSGIGSSCARHRREMARSLVAGDIGWGRSWGTASSKTRSTEAVMSVCPVGRSGPRGSQRKGEPFMATG